MLDRIESVRVKPASDEYSPQLARLLDCCIAFAAAEMVGAALPFRVLEDCCESSTVKDCAVVWNCLESRTEQLTKAPFLTPTTNASKLALLGLANGVLGRLSSTQDTEFSGRILMFLAYAYPLSERSGVNTSGRFHSANTTSYEGDSGRDGDEVNGNAANGGAGGASTTAPVDRALYTAFWRLQRYMVVPKDAVADGAAWERFVGQVGTVLAAFEAQPLDGGDDASDRASLAGQQAKTGQAATSPAKMRAVKRRRSRAGSLSGEPGDDFYCTKYLTSSSLLSLQLRDGQLRRHILIQVLVLCQYLRSIDSSFVDNVALRKTKNAALELLRQTPPDGRRFAASIQHILQREENWMAWKSAGCKPYEREPLADDGNVADEPLAKRSRTTSAPMLFGMESKTVDYLWSEDAAELNVTEALKDPDQLVVRPNLKQFLQPLFEAMHPDTTMGDEFSPKHDKVFVWKALRLLADDDMACIVDVLQSGLEDVVGKKYPDETGRDKINKAEEEAARIKAEEAKAALAARLAVALPNPKKEGDGSGKRGAAEAESGADSHKEAGEEVEKKASKDANMEEEGEADEDDKEEGEA